MAVVRTVDVEPLETDNEWLRYFLFTRNAKNGNRLCSLYRTGPIQANEIEVAAPLVLWRPHARSHFVVRQPQGILDSSGADADQNLNAVRFPGLPIYSLVVHQTGGHRVVVNSQCRNHPQRILLKRSTDILVQLNNSLIRPDPRLEPQLIEHDGAIELWVRVVG